VFSLNDRSLNPVTTSEVNFIEGDWAPFSPPFKYTIVVEMRNGGGCPARIEAANGAKPALIPHSR
jgi:hypothetical protein